MHWAKIRFTLTPHLKPDFFFFFKCTNFLLARKNSSYWGPAGGHEENRKGLGWPVKCPTPNTQEAQLESEVDHRMCREWSTLHLTHCRQFKPQPQKPHVQSALLKWKSLSGVLGTFPELRLHPYSLLLQARDSGLGNTHLSVGSHMGTVQTVQHRCLCSLFCCKQRCHLQGGDSKHLVWSPKVS